MPTVVKVESDAGSPTRQAGFRIGGESSSLYFQSENRGKYSILAGLQDVAPAGRLAALLERADVVIEDLGPGELEVAGLAPSGCQHVHVAVDDHSRRAYAEVLPTAGQHDALAFLDRAFCWYRAQGVAVEEVMTGNGPAYVSRA